MQNHAAPNSASISVVIPALNEAKVLPANVAQLLAIPEVHEVLVVDGFSSDGTLEALQGLSTHLGFEKLHILQGTRGRATQMNYGAARARGDWLLFHHADSRLPTCGIQAIAQLAADVHWGGFHHRFAPTNWKLNIVSWLHNYRWRRTGVVYGDQSMFMRAKLFHQLGGFAPDTIEDLELSDRALACAPSTLLPYEVQTDARKFLQIGEFRALFQVAVILWRYERERRVGMANFFRPYR